MASTTEHKGAVEDEDTGAHIAPIVKLDEVAVTTGDEDDDDPLFDPKAKLYRFDKDGTMRTKNIFIFLTTYMMVDEVCSESGGVEQKGSGVLVPGGNDELGGDEVVTETRHPCLGMAAAELGCGCSHALECLSVRDGAVTVDITNDGWPCRYSLLCTDVIHRGVSTASRLRCIADITSASEEQIGCTDIVVVYEKARRRKVA
ncbi:Ran-binding protein 1 homolog b-like protein [Tanacetum coccineum]